MSELVLWLMSFASIGIMLASATALAFLITHAAVKAAMRHFRTLHQRIAKTPARAVARPAFKAAARRGGACGKGVTPTAAQGLKDMRTPVEQDYVPFRDAG
jgi:hypothetical protein